MRQRHPNISIGLPQETLSVARISLTGSRATPDCDWSYTQAHCPSHDNRCHIASTNAYSTLSCIRRQQNKALRTAGPPPEFLEKKSRPYSLPARDYFPVRRPLYYYLHCTLSKSLWSWLGRNPSWDCVISDRGCCHLGPRSLLSWQRFHSLCLR